MVEAAGISRAAVCAVLIALATACGGGGSPAVLPNMPESDAVAPVERSTQPNGNGLFNVVMHPQEPEALPLKGVSWAAPSELLGMLPPLPVAKDPSCTGSGFHMSGGDFADELLYSRVIRTGSENQYAFYTPYWTGGDLGDAAVAMYRWNLRGFSGSQTMGFTWADDFAPVDLSAFWVGFGDLTKDSWDWYAGPQDNVLTIDTFGPYRAASGEMLMAVVLLGTDQALLEKMEAGVPEQRATGDDIELPEGLTSIPLLGFSGALPAAVDLSAECAPVNDQLGWYACTAFAVGDGAFNFELGRMYGQLGWDLTLDNFLVSPKYLYIISGEVGGYPPSPLFGRYTSKVIFTIQQEGIATEANAPYDNIYAKNWDDAAELDAEVLAADYWVEVPCNTWEGVETVKAVLARQRKVLVMRVNLNDDFYDYDGAGVWYPLSQLGGGHAMCIVGYDDARGDAGAFKVRNSWGTYWGDDGHVWVDYRTFVNPATQAGAWTLREDYSPAVVERFGLATPAMPPPTGVTASDGAFAEYIEVTWEPYPAATEFSIYRDEQDNLAAVIAGDSTSWQDTTITDSYGHIYWVQADQSALSPPDVGYLAALPHVLSVEPTTGLEGDTVTFVAGGTGSGPMTYVWHFGGGATPGISYDPRPQVVLGEPDVYSAYVKITNDLGANTFEFDLTVNGYPPLIGYVTGRSGFSGDTITLSAGLEGETTGYSWSIPAGAVPASSSEPAPQITLGAPGLYEGTLQVTGPWGHDVHFFELAVLDPAVTAWTLPGYDGRNSGQSPLTGPQSANLKWKYYAGERSVDENSNHFRTPLVLDDGSLIVCCDADLSGASLRRITADGTPVWLLTESGTSGRFGQPLLGTYSGNLYVARNSLIDALNVDDGSQRWHYSPETAGVAVQPIAESSQSVLYAIIGGKTLVALAAADGDEMAAPYQLADRYNVAGPSLIAPSGTLFIASEFGGDDLLLAFDTFDNAPLGSLIIPEMVSGMALSADGRTLFTSDTAGETRAYDTATCRELWHQPLTAGGGGGTPTNAPRVMADGTVITSNKADLICALQPDTGGIIWGYALPPDASCYSAPAIGRDGTVYLGGSKSKFYAVRDDVLLWQSADAGSLYFNGDPSLAPDGTLYCGANDGWLYAFGPGDGAELVPPYIESVAPLAGVAGTEVAFSAQLDGSEPMEFSWEFGAAASPSNSTDTSPTVTLGPTGIYSCEVTATNAYGEHAYGFTLSIDDDPGGSGWKAYTIYTSTGDELQADSALIAGEPAVAVFDKDMGKIYYLASTVAEPTSVDQWITETASVSPAPDNGVTLASVNGEAAVVFQINEAGLAYARRAGGSWPAHFLDLDAEYALQHALAEVNGYPATAYLRYMGSNYRLQYARATQTAPQSDAEWVRMEIDETLICQHAYTVALIDNAGVPNISFGVFNMGAPCLSYARATASGPSSSEDWAWHIVDGQNASGETSDMLLLDSNPAIAYRSSYFEPALYFALASSAAPDGAGDWATHIVDLNGALRMGNIGRIGTKPVIGYSSGESDMSLSLAESQTAAPDSGDDWQLELLPSQNDLLSFLVVAQEPVYFVFSPATGRLSYYYYSEE